MQVDSTPFRMLDACSERGCVYPATFLVWDMWGAVPMCKQHRDLAQLSASPEDRSAPFQRDHGDFKNGVKPGFVEGRVITQDWFDHPHCPYERIPPYLWEQVKALAQCGIANRAVARMIGYHRNAVRRLILAEFPQVMDAPCACGRTRRHQGWCRPRFRKSNLRQEFMRLLHIKRFAKAAKEAGYDLGAVAAMVNTRFHSVIQIQAEPIAVTVKAADTKSFGSRNYNKRRPVQRAYKTTFEDQILDGLVDATAYANRKNWGEKSNRQWRDRGIGVDKNFQTAHDVRGGVNRKRGKRRGAHAS